MRFSFLFLSARVGVVRIERMVPEFYKSLFVDCQKLAFSNDSFSSPLKPFSNAFYYSVLFLFLRFSSY